MTGPHDEPTPEVERVVDAITDGAEVEWDAELSDPAADSETLAALRLIDHVARLHRGNSAPARNVAETEPGEASWGSLRIRSRLGAGAYGEVYRAFDPTLRREVALKLWSNTVRPTVIERLLGEARALARVRHPNVLVVHGADVHDGQAGMWTELLEGSTLEQLIAELGPGNWRETALIGIELCRALAAVHAMGFAHGDVKGSNVMRERGGRIVLMDFGSASHFPAAGVDLRAGVQGTPLAMAPEVLGGTAATPAADLYSLGVLLFRIVTARYPVEADSLEGLREKLGADPVPSLRTLRADVPLAFSRVVERALEREPGDRFASAAELERSLTEALSSDWGHAITPAPAPAPAPRSRPAALQRLAAWTAVAAALALTLAGAWWLSRAPAPGPAPTMQFTLQLPIGEHIRQLANVVVSPDGRNIAFASEDSLGHRALWIRRFDARGSSRVPGTEGAMYPFWSPDSRDIGFFSNSSLKRVGIVGGRVVVVCPAELGRGGSWSRFGTILFAGSTQGPLLRVPAEGGSPIPATSLDAANSEVSHRWPCFLPDGDHFLYVSTPDRKGAFDLFVGSLRSDRRAYVGPVESGATYALGSLIYLSNRTLEARAFSLRTLRWAGEPVPISELPGVGGAVAEPSASVSQNGTLVYSPTAARASRLEWIDTRTGYVKSLSVGPYFSPSLSPDGRRIAVERLEGPGRSNIWMVDALTGAGERWTSDGGLNRSPKWSPAGDSIVFSSNRNGHYELYVRATDGSLAERLLYSPPHALMMWPNDWRTGGLITFDQYEPGTSYNVFELRSGLPVAVARTAASEKGGALSPDQRWLAFESDASGRTQIYLLDRVANERFVLPGEGVAQARWSRGAGRLYFHSPQGDVFEVKPLPGMPPTRWPAHRLFRTGAVESYDVDASGQHLLCCFTIDSGRPEEVTVLTGLSQVLTSGL